MTATTITTVNLKDIVLQARFQVRAKLDLGIVKRYASAYKQGEELPPLIVAKVNKALVLVDGWHRLGALRSLGSMLVDVEIVECASERDALWLAAKANLTHGLPLKAKEVRHVFRAYVHSRQHYASKGRLKSYRDIASDLGGVVSYNTIRNWMQKDYPRVFKAMGGNDEPPAGNGGLIGQEVVTMSETSKEHLGIAYAAFRGIADSDERDEVIREAEEVLKAMRQGEIKEPEQFDFGDDEDF